jgi:predicted amidophosphoribosyltransferase
VADFFDAAADLLLGATCPGCGRPGRRLCAACAADLAAWRVQRRRPDIAAGLPTWSAGAYTGLPRRLVNAAKEERRWDVLAALGDGLAAALAGLLGDVGWGGPILIVPAPSRPAAVRRRGCDVGLRLALAAQARLAQAGCDARVGAVLRHRRRVADQTGLAAVERRANLAEAFALRPGRAPPGPGRPAVLADDVVTTGATLAEAARALRQAGGRLLGAAVVAATPGPV